MRYVVYKLTVNRLKIDDGLIEDADATIAKVEKTYSDFRNAITAADNLVKSELKKSSSRYSPNLYPSIDPITNKDDLPRYEDVYEGWVNLFLDKRNETLVYVVFGSQFRATNRQQRLLSEGRDTDDIYGDKIDTSQLYAGAIVIEEE